MAQTNSVNALAYLQSRPLTPVATFAVYIAVVCVSWAERRRSRVALGKLEDHLLEDIGVTRAQARKEAQRPFWQI